ncbi:hypothetical protein VIGAN_01402500 [Vigna angularis var. angularis]|uniref:Uncharacterized protein n=1 Tax=Vigna angularis var. angularis TaxID=157739 RepID=A0A0S3R5Y1_PHAAN|nr:uncharacterized protein LOC108341318 [Vigna angularis]BAT76068.1 hypothetical protein VIGAN_01402500 [Vigna angularis var. angularis]
MATTITSFLTSSPSSFQHNTNLKLRLSRRDAHLTIYDKDKSCQYIHGVPPKLRGRYQKQHAVAGSGNQPHISGREKSVLVPEKHDSISENTFLVNKSCFHLPQNGGKPGLVRFCDLNRENEVISSNSEKTQNSASWILGPAILVASFIFPPIVLPEVMLNIFGHWPSKVFHLLLFTEATFYSGVAVFLLLLDSLTRRRQPNHSAKRSVTLTPGYQISSVVTVLLSTTIPIATMILSWEWAFPLVPTTFVPHLVGIVVQFTFEQIARYWNSPSWAAISMIFHAYRFHQIHRAGNLLTYISFREGTSEIVNNLGILSNVLYLLLVMCVWSFSSFLMRLLLELNSDAKLI